MIEISDIEESFIGKHKLPIVIALSGLIITGLGILLMFIKTPEDRIEIISSEASILKNISVDIEGSVQKPGLYELPFGSRIDSLLTSAGGLSAEADRAWIEKNLNRAQKLSDGMKIYIPAKSEARGEKKEVGGQELAVGSGEVAKIQVIDINTATLEQLDTLPGIGPKTAQKIIENRPYSQTLDLLSKKVVSNKVYGQIENKISVY